MTVSSGDRMGRAPCLAFALLLAAGAHGCVVGPEYIPPEMAIPDAWSTALESGLSAESADLTRYWEVLQDPVLDRLMEAVPGAAFDVRRARARLAQARSLRGFESARRFPLADGVGGANVGTSRTNPEGGVTTRTDFTTVGGGIDAAYEVDLFGHVTRSIEAADANVASRERTYLGEVASVRTAIAIAYIELRTQQARQATLESHIARQRESLRYVESGQAPSWAEVDIALSRRNLAESESALPQILQAQRTAMFRIAVLLSHFPGHFEETLEPVLPIPDPPPAFAVALPVDLIRRRPDIGAAERALAREVARIGVAEAELYPRFALSGSLGAAALHTDGGDVTSRGASIGPSFRWRLFDAGRLRALVSFQDARAAEALVDYEVAVLAALEAAENSVGALTQERARFSSVSLAAGEAGRSAKLALQGYRDGKGSGRPMVQAEREARVLADAAVVSRGRIAAFFVTLCRDLGGGYDEAEVD